MTPAEKLALVQPESAPLDGAADFLSGGGEMGALIRSFDWASTPIDAPHRWSAALRTMVRVLLANRFPMLLWWGPEYVSIYNDAYSPILGRKHPWGLGRPVRECWSEIWDVLKALIDTPFHGGPATWVEDIELQLHRSDFTEETHFTVAYSPVPDDAPGTIGGVLATVHEITEKVIGERRGAILRELGARATEARTEEEACLNAAQILARHPKDIPFALLYLVDTEGKHARIAATARLEETPSLGFPSIGLEHDAADSWPLVECWRSRDLHILDDLSARFGKLPTGTWPDPPHSAAIVPIRANFPQQLAGFLIAGLSSRLRFDESYKNFLDLAAGQIASSLSAARAYEEERRRAEALAEIDRTKTAFFSNVSHEFRTPLTLMLGPLESLLRGDGALAPQAREQVETAHRNSLRLLKLVNSLLDFSRIEAGRMKAVYEPVDLSSLTTDLASNFRSAMAAAGLELIVRCEPLPEPVYIDREMWEKIVLNLLSNAFKFTFEGHVEVSLRESGENAVLAVSDTGTGIPPQELPHVFERFHRVEGARGRTYEGTGIGLALIQELVKFHGGTIAVESELGKGSRFTITIPLGTAHLPQARINAGERPAASTATRAEAFSSEAFTWIARDRLSNPSDESSSAPPAALKTGRPQILLADDNADMRDHVIRVLGSGYDVTAVGDGLAALKAIRDRRHDLVISDVMMPGLDGFGLLDALRADSQLREMPVILLSARAGEEARTEGISAGADDYLTKPFAATELVARVETTLNLQRLRQEARAQFETLLNQAPIGVYLVDDAFRILQVNPTAARVFAEIPDLIGRDFDEVIHRLWPQPYADEIVQLFRHTLETGEPYVAPEWTQERLDNGVREYYEWRIDRIPLSGSRFGVVCYFRDISQQVLAREEIARSEQRFRAFVTATSDVIYRMSPDWSEMRQLQGRNFIADTEEPNHLWIEKYILPEDRERIMATIHHAIDTKTRFELEHRVIRVDGTVGWTFSRAVPLLDDGGQIVEWLGTARDTTVTKEAQEQIREVADRLRFMAESMPQKIFTATAEGHIDYFNSRWMDYAGLPFEALRDWGWTELIHPEDAKETLRLWRDCIESGEDFQFVHRFRRVDGAYRWHLTRAQAMRRGEGKVAMWIGSNTEIHEQKHTEEELRRANKALEQFAYTASHDLQEPLRTVKVYSELLTRTQDGLDEEALECLGFIRTGATRMETMVRDLLAYTQTSLLDKPTIPVDANASLRVALENLAASITESGAVIETGVLPLLPVHATHLQQLFQNLIGNAIKYRRADVTPRIKIAAQRQTENWEFTVADNGSGIEPEFHEKIFGLFERLHKDPSYSGTGIGLAICQRIVERYQGRIWVESRPGAGATFRFTLPI
ncbi:MAG TPA: ATP-binding protein [Bryobacteraceae bacterium]|nr:ATP-binding protein [Bryobacteraceae bacterium]